jgi:hypothetical protein
MKWILLSIFTISLLSSFAMTPPDSTANIIQKGTAKYLISEGKRYYNEGNYRVSLVKFREALTKDKGNAEATFWLAECHLELGNYEKAKTYVEEALAKDPVIHEEANYLLGVCNHRLGYLTEAIENFRLASGQLSAPRAKALEVDNKIAQCKRAGEFMKKPGNVAITCLSRAINSAFEETAPTLSPDGKSFYFVSRRADNLGGGISPGDQRYFEDIYVSLWDEEKQEWGDATNSSDLIEQVNSFGMDAVSYISPDGKDMYLTVNTEVMDKPKPKTKHSDIFTCRLNKRGTWNSPKSVGKSLNSLFFDAAATFTANGETVYFISERPGGEGKSDIWVAYKDGNNWTKPENLGPVINSTGNETTVQVSPDGSMLYFSSTGHEGMGGYDVYVSKNIGGEWQKPVNLGYPINTVADETHFVYYPSMKKGYYAKFSTAENNGLGARDIFELDLSNYAWPEF